MTLVSAATTPRGSAATTPRGSAATTPRGSAAADVRARARDDLTRRIVESGRRQLGEVGAAALSLRAVARELGMASSAVYRYVATRDDLLTRLIVEAFDSVGEAAERADAQVERDDHVARWRAVCHGVREWALVNPHEFALVYGSPVPGYVAPPQTLAAAVRSARVMGSLLRDAVTVGAQPLSGLQGPRDAAVRADLGNLAASDVFEMPVAGPPAEQEALLGLVAAGLAAWQQLFGCLVLELSGHLVGVVVDTDAWFEELVDGWGRRVLPGPYARV
jgi:AcrR family transcriptional regulator